MLSIVRDRDEDEEAIEYGPMIQCTYCTCPIRTVRLANGYQKIVHGEQVAAYIGVAHLWHGEDRLYTPGFGYLNGTTEQWSKLWHFGAIRHEKWGGKCGCPHLHPLHLRA